MEPGVASVCTGAFLLAGAGLLDGEACHDALEVRNPAPAAPPSRQGGGDRIFRKDGGIWTAAGINAGIDLALAMVEEDLGAEVSRATADPGGLSPPARRAVPVLGHARHGPGVGPHPGCPDLYPRTSDRGQLAIEDLAEVACLSPRQFGRVFLAQTGGPGQAVERLRAEAATAREWSEVRSRSRPSPATSASRIRSVCGGLSCGFSAILRRAFAECPSRSHLASHERPGRTPLVRAFTLAEAWFSPTVRRPVASRR